MTLKKRLIYTYTGITLATLFGATVRIIIFPQWSAGLHVWVTAITFLVFTTVVEGHIFIHQALNKWLPFQNGLFKRIAIQVLVSAVIMKAIHFIVFPHINNVLKTNNVFQTSNDYVFFVITTLAIILMSVLINSILIGSFFFLRWKEFSLTTERLEKEKAQVQFDGLKNQLNPHFLFNSMASLSSLINEDPKLANRYLQHLSKVYRYVLQQDKSGTVSLKTEIEFIQNYVFLLKTRFSEMIQVDFKVPSDLMDAKIVPVTLQNLFENAIKHNSISQHEPLHILVSAKDQYLTVENNLQIKKRVETSNGTGLQKLKSLYAYLSKQPVLIEQTDKAFIVKIPLLH